MCERRYYSSNVSSGIWRLTDIPLLPYSCFINVRVVSLAPQSLVQCWVQQAFNTISWMLHEWVFYRRGACIYVSVLIILYFSPLCVMEELTLWWEVKLLSPVWLSAIPWTVAHQAPPCMEFSRQEYWSRLPFPFPEELPDPGIEPGSPTWQADPLPTEPAGKRLFCGRHWRKS